MALTASATNKVQEDIKYILKTDDIDTVFQSFYRPNLKIKVMDKSQHTDIVGDINNFIHSYHRAIQVSFIVFQGKNAKNYLEN